MDNEIMVTVVCPTYNQGEYLQSGMNSILMQEVNFKYEVLVGEDCSPDNTSELLKPYEEKYAGIVQVFHREKNLKQSKNVYDLFMRSKGKYVIILDLDDYWTDKRKLQKQVDFLEAHPEYIGVSHDFDTIDAEGKKIEDNNRLIKKFLGKDFSIKDFLENGFVYQTGTFCYRNIWKEKSDWSILYKADETVVDLTINSILLSRQNIFVLPDNMSVYRKVISKNGKNCRSVSQKDIGRRWMLSARQFSILTAYFEGTVDYSSMWKEVIINYLKAYLKKEEGNFDLKTILKMWRKTTPVTRKRVRSELLFSLRNRFKRKVMRSNG